MTFLTNMCWFNYFSTFLSSSDLMPCCLSPDLYPSASIPPSLCFPPSHFTTKVFHSHCPAVFVVFLFIAGFFLLLLVSFRWSRPDTSRLSHSLTVKQSLITQAITCALLFEKKSNRWLPGPLQCRRMQNSEIFYLTLKKTKKIRDSTFEAFSSGKMYIHRNICSITCQAKLAHLLPFLHPFIHPLSSNSIPRLLV